MTIENRLLNRLVNRCAKRRSLFSANVSLSVLVGLAVASTLFGCNPASVSTPSVSVGADKPTDVLPTPVDTPPINTTPAAPTLSESAPAATLPADTLASDLLEQSELDLPTGLERADSTESLSPEEKAVTERLVIASISDPQAVRVFLSAMREAAGACETGCGTEQSRDAIARLVHYPFTTYEAGEIVETYNAPEDLLVDFEQVITQPVLDAMREVRYESLFANYQGVMIGNGEVWFSEFDEGLRIRAINGQ